MNVLCLLSDLSYALDNDRNGSLFTMLLEVDIFRISYKPTYKGEKECVLYAYVSLAGAKPDLHESLQNFSVCLICSTGSPCSDLISEPMSIKS